MYIEKEELLKLLEEKYGDLTDDRGGHLDGVWFSISTMVDLIEECQVINNN